MEIPNPKRILLLSKAGTDISPITKFLDSTSKSKTQPSQDPDLTSLIHHIETAYYKAAVPIWTDTIGDISKWSDEWKTMDGAGEVVAALGAVIFVFKAPSSQEELDEIRAILSSVSSTLEEYFGFANENVISGEAPERLAVVLPSTTSSSFAVSWEDLDDMCFDGGNWELINGAEEGKVDEITRERTGLSRLAEFLETIDWEQITKQEAGDVEDLLAVLGLDEQGTMKEEDDDDAFGTIQDAIDAREPFLSQKEQTSSPLGIDDPWAKLDGEDAFNSENGTEDEVDKISAMMLKLRAVKEQASLLPRLSDAGSLPRRSRRS